MQEIKKGIIMTAPMKSHSVWSQEDTTGVYTQDDCLQMEMDRPRVKQRKHPRTLDIKKELEINSGAKISPGNM